ncbi:MAG: sulfatase-like hydrolase/transferase [Lacibacter sp.]
MKRKYLYSNYGFLLLISFFILHQWNEYKNLVTVYDILQTTFLLILFSIVYFGVSVLVMRDKRQAGVFTTFSLLLFLFYGTLSSFLIETVRIVSNGAACIFIVLGLICLAFFVIRRRQSGWTKLTLYFNSLFIILIFAELMTSVVYSLRTQNQVKKDLFFLNSIKAVEKKMPSVYLIVLDEYSGNETLEKSNFSNQKFLSGLSSEGFRIVRNAHSNYNSTIPSIASLFSCNYVGDSLWKNPYSTEGYVKWLSEIKNNQVISMFKKLGFEIKNYSPFPIEASGKTYNTRFIPTHTTLIVSNTIFDDIIELTPLFIARRIGSDNVMKRMLLNIGRDNFTAIEQVLKDVDKQKKEPVFCYTHLMMPHPPFIMDSLGNVNVDYFRRANLSQAEKNNTYLQYLRYTNDIVLNLVKHIKAGTKGESVIILMSDHGSRFLAEGLNGDESFNSLNCVYMPPGFSADFYDGMTNVNQFRILFSSLLDAKLPLLKDSIVYSGPKPEQSFR